MAKRQPAAKKTPSRASTTTPDATPSAVCEPAGAPDPRHAAIAEAAYLMAENDGFQGDSVQYWLQAEAGYDYPDA